MHELPQTPKHLEKAVTADRGVDDVVGQLRDHGVVSFPWPQDKDKGIDLVCFVVDGDQATSFVFGVQVKAGSSFRTKGGATVPVEGHGSYWETSTMPVFVASPQGDDIYIEDAYSVLKASQSRRSIACTVTINEAIGHVRMRARAHALAPELSSVIRMATLSQAIEESPEIVGGAFHQVAVAYRRLDSRNLEPEFALAMADLVLWIRRHDADRAALECYVKENSDAVHFLIEVADALAQLTLVAGCQEAAGTADDETETLNKQIDRLEQEFAYLLEVWALAGNPVRKPLEIIQSWGQIDVGSGVHLPGRLLNGVEAAWQKEIRTAVHAGVGDVRQDAAKILTATRKWLGKKNPPPGMYSRMIHLLVTDFHWGPTPEENSEA